MNTYLYYKKYFQTCEFLHHNSRQMQSTYLFVNPLKKWAVYVQHDDVLLHMFCSTYLIFIDIIYGLSLHVFLFCVYIILSNVNVHKILGIILKCCIKTEPPTLFFRKILWEITHYCINYNFIITCEKCRNVLEGKKTLKKHFVVSPGKEKMQTLILTLMLSNYKKPESILHSEDVFFTNYICCTM